MNQIGKFSYNFLSVLKLCFLKSKLIKSGFLVITIEGFHIIHLLFQISFEQLLTFKVRNDQLVGVRKPNLISCLILILFQNGIPVLNTRRLCK